MYIRLCYASTRVEKESNLLEDLSDILLCSHRFNQQHHIHGVLYYSEGQYFQCLEGHCDDVAVLYEKILKDQRHTKIHRFPDQTISQLYFLKWSMKYVKDSTKISRFFSRLGFDKFQPYALNDENIQDFVHLLLKIDHTEPVHKAK